MAAFLRTYPEVQAALKDALSALVSKRPGDPISFLAEKLREANRELQEQKREKERAVVKIQSLGPGIRHSTPLSDHEYGRTTEWTAATRGDNKIQQRVHSGVASVREREQRQAYNLLN